MTSGYFPHYATTPESINGSADELERSTLRVGDVQRAVHTAHRPVRAAVEGELATVIAEAPDRLDERIRHTTGAHLVAVGALRLFGQAVRVYDGTMDDLESEWQASLADDFGIDPMPTYIPATDSQASHLANLQTEHAAEVAAARDATLALLLVRKGLAEAILDDRAGEAARFLALPTDEALPDLFAAGHLPSKVPMMFPEISFAYSCLPSDVGSMSDRELADYAIAHPEQAAALTPVLTDGARQLMSRRIGEMRSWQYVGLHLSELSDAYGFRSSAAMWLVLGGDSISNADVVEEISRDGSMLDDPRIRAEIAARIRGFDGYSDGARVSAASEYGSGPLVVSDSVDNLALVTAYGRWVSEADSELPYAGLAYLRSFYDAVGAEVDQVPDLSWWLGAPGQTAFAEDYAAGRDLPDELIWRSTDEDGWELPLSGGGPYGSGVGAVQCRADSHGTLTGPDGQVYDVVDPGGDADLADGGWTTVGMHTGAVAFGDPIDSIWEKLGFVAGSPASYDWPWHSIGRDQDEYLIMNPDGTAVVNGEPEEEWGRLPEHESGGDVDDPHNVVSTKAKAAAGVAGLAIMAMEGISEAQLAEYDRHLSSHVVFQENDAGERRAVVTLRQVVSDGEEIVVNEGRYGYDHEGTLVQVDREAQEESD